MLSRLLKHKTARRVAEKNMAGLHLHRQLRLQSLTLNIGTKQLFVNIAKNFVWR